MTLAVFARQAGSATAFAPLIRYLRERGESPLVLAFPQAGKVYAEQGLAYEAVHRNKEALVLLGAAKPSSLLSGTSYVPEKDVLIWTWARSKGIPVTAFVDAWNHYAERFNPDPGSDTQLCLPDRIAVVDSIIRNRLIEAGIPDSTITITGHPGFEELLHKHCDTNGFPSPHDSTLAVFFSEPTDECYNEGQSIKVHLGFSEEQALSMAIEALAHLGLAQKRHFTLLVKQHPLEKPTKLIPIVERSATNPFLECRLTHNATPSLIRTADLIMGISSTCLYQASLLDKPVISILPVRTSPLDMIDNNPKIQVCNDASLVIEVIKELDTRSPKQKPIPLQHNSALQQLLDATWTTQVC